MTGDGYNDGHLLKKADVGFSQENMGTLTAKKASGIILLDDSFNSIANTLKWGRNVFESVRKYLQLHLTALASAFVIISVGFVLD